ncbi:Phosphate carrier protein, mitochondrial [Aphelenchoides besseyi]|nr:Phosphate carrier protein, mitochondrial [Aphelenchoides besseyi]
MTSEETCDKKKPVIITPFGKNYNSSLSSYSGVISILLIWCYLYFSAVGTLYDGISSFLWNSDSHIHVLSKVVSQVAVTSSGDENAVEFGSAKFFLFCSISGFLSCGLTHTAIVPLDLIKCRIQVNPTKYKGILSGFSKTLREDGLIGLSKGWSPTAVGYSMQGMAKFGLYELFKILYANMLGEENAYLWRTSLYLAASASAEFFADILLAPMEATKVRIQTSPAAPPTLRGCASLIYESEGLRGFYKGLPPLWMRQIPYTMMVRLFGELIDVKALQKFACFERTVELLYAEIVPKPQDQCTKAEQLVVTFVAGYIAGVFCAVVSHPADTIVSKLNQDAGANAVDILKKLGLVGVWGGLVPRIVMIGTLTALQWFIYDGVKVALGIPRPPLPSH